LSRSKLVSSGDSSGDRQFRRQFRGPKFRGSSGDSSGSSGDSIYNHVFLAFSGQLLRGSPGRNTPPNPGYSDNVSKKTGVCPQFNPDICDQQTLSRTREPRIISPQEDTPIIQFVKIFLVDKQRKRGLPPIVLLIVLHIIRYYSIIFYFFTYGMYFLSSTRI